MAPEPDKRAPRGNGFTEYKLLILKQLETLDKDVREVCERVDTRASAEEVSKLSGKVDDLRTSVEALKIKSGLWGLAAGSLPVASFIVVKLLWP